MYLLGSRYLYPLFCLQAILTLYVRKFEKRNDMKFILKYTGRTLFDSHLLLIVDATPFEVNSKCITFSISKTS